MSNVLSSINFVPPSVPTPPSPAEATITSLADGIQKLFKHNVNERIRLYNMFWNNTQQNCSPPQLALAAGSSLMSVVESDIALVTFLTTQATNAGLVLPSGATFGVPSQWSLIPSPSNDGTGSVMAVTPSGV